MKLLQLARNCLTGMAFSLCCFSNSSASVDICQQPTAYSHLSIAYYNQQQSYLDQSNGKTRQENYEFDLLFELSNNWMLGAGHRYTILKFDPLVPQTNGHLHTFFLPLHRQSNSDRKSFRFSIAPALSASSNVMKDPGEYNNDAVQVLAALIWSTQLSDQMILHYGVCGDHRFGNYEIYPSVGVDFRPNADWTIELGFPTSQLTYKVSSSLTSSLRIAPDGNEWYVEDRGLEKQSQVVHEAWMFEWAVNWQAHKHFMVTASIGRRFQNRYEMTLLDESRVTLRSDPVTRMGAALAWRF